MWHKNNKIMIDKQIKDKNSVLLLRNFWRLISPNQKTT